MRTVLLVDDDTNMLRAMETLVSLEGYRVKTASNGAVALRTALAEPPDIIVSDCMMPEMDGMQLSLAVHSNDMLAHVPLVLVSAVVMPPMEMHVDGFLRKPFAAAQLLEIIGRLTATHTH